MRVEANDYIIRQPKRKGIFKNQSWLLLTSQTIATMGNSTTKYASASMNAEHASSAGRVVPFWGAAQLFW